MGTQSVSEMTTSGLQTRTIWAIDASHSSVEFGVKHMMFTTMKGRFSGVSGTIEVDEADLASSSAAVEIDATTIDTRDEKRDEHLRAADFFDVAQYPTITFRSTRVEPTGGNEFRVTGELTLRGVTHEVTLDVEQTGRGSSPWGMEVIGFEATTKISRKAFGLEWNVALETGGFLVGDEIKITLDIQAVKQG